MYIFIDESGDLGFNFCKAKTTKYFVMTALIVSDKKEIESTVKKIFHDFGKSQKKHHPGTLHCFKEMPTTRKKLLRLISSRDCSIAIVYILKEKIKVRTRDDKHAIYSELTGALLDYIFISNDIKKPERIEIIVSRRETNKILNNNFVSCLKKKTRKLNSLDINIEIRYPSQEKGLQAADFVSWTVFRKLEYGDLEYYRLIKDKIIKEISLN